MREDDSDPRPEKKGQPRNALVGLTDAVVKMIL